MSKRSHNSATQREMPVLAVGSSSSAGHSNATGGSAKGKMPEMDSPGPDVDAALPKTHESHGHHKVIAHRFLSSAEWSSIANGLGGVKDGESHRPCHPSH
ncbi:hypothetical protein E4U41_004677 [Claviceps citrina]|nr:hypothetical protein E4U41_004677 [Claviceps citrina]